MNGKPYRGRIGARPFNAVACMSAYEDMIAGAELSILRLAFKTQARGAREHRHPFIPGLVIPEARRTGLPGGDDPLDLQMRPNQEFRDDLFRLACRRHADKKISGLIDGCLRELDRQSSRTIV
jgi:hypothetical protein